MTTPALRSPARAEPVARSYLRLLAGGRAVRVCLLALLLVVLCGVNSLAFEGFAWGVLLMAFFPLVQWGATGRSPLEHALPIGRVRDDLLRVACGAVWAAAALALAVGLTSLLSALGNGRGDGFGVYPPLLFVLGLAAYLLGAAVWVGGRGSGALVAVAILVWGSAPALLRLGPGPRLMRLLALREPPSDREVLALAGVAALALAAALGTVALAAGRRARLPAVRSGRTRGSRGLPLPAGAPRLPLGALRRPTPLHVVLWREAALIRNFMLAGMAVVAFVALWVLPLRQQGPGREHAWTSAVYLYALVWPTFVWMPWNTPGRVCAEPLPVAAATHRLVRVAAGAVWLEAAVLVLAAARGFPPPTAGVACVALLLYLLGCFPYLLAREHVVGWAYAWLFFALLVMLPLVWNNAPRTLFSPASALSVLFLPDPGPWLPATLLWGALLATLVAAAAALGVRQERGVARSPAETTGRAA